MLVKPTFIRRDERGIFVEALNGDTWQNVSYGLMKKGAVMGNHYHKKAKVFFYIITGNVRIDTINVQTQKTDSFVLAENEGMIFMPYSSHAIRFTENATFIMGKSEKYQPDNTDTYTHVVPEVDKQ